MLRLALGEFLVGRDPLRMLERNRVTKHPGSTKPIKVTNRKETNRRRKQSAAQRRRRKLTKSCLK